MKMLEEAFDKIYDKTEEDILTMSNSMEDCITPEDLDPECQNLVVFDDMIGEKDLSMVEDLAIRIRHQNGSLLFLTQIYMKVPRSIRLNTHYFVFFNTPNRRELSIIYQENGYNKSKEEFIRMFNKATEKRYDFFMIDNKTTVPELQYRRNFDFILKKQEN